MTTAKDILLKAAEIVEQGWTQGELARTVEDSPCGVSNPNACKFCMSGAINKAVGNEHDGNYRRAMNAANSVAFRRGYGNIPEFNDARERTQAEVAATLREAANAT
jgi:hypothetical protein